MSTTFNTYKESNRVPLFILSRRKAGSWHDLHYHVFPDIHRNNCGLNEAAARLRSWTWSHLYLTISPPQSFTQLFKNGNHQQSHSLGFLALPGKRANNSRLSRCFNKATLCCSKNHRRRHNFVGRNHRLFIPRTVHHSIISKMLLIFPCQVGRVRRTFRAGKAGVGLDTTKPVTGG